MDTVRFVKSFSKGQITIPKAIRNAFGINGDFWLKLYIANGKLIAEPVEKSQKKSDYSQKLLSIKGDWFLEKEFKNTREEIEQRLQKSS